MIIIPNLGLSLLHFFIICIVFSCMLTLISFLNNNIEDPIHREINSKENKLQLSEYIELYLNRFIHYNIVFVSLFMPYILKPNIIIYWIYLCLVSTIGYSWYLLKECPFNIHEKQILDKHYMNGFSEINPFMALIIPNWLFIAIIAIVYRINLLLVLFRIVQHYYIPKNKIPEDARM